jgi:hypothetical protein
VSLPKPKPTRYAKNWDADMPYDVGLGDLDAAVEAACARAGTAEAAAHAESLAQQAHENLEALAALVLRESRHGTEQRRREREKPQGEALAALLRAEETVPTRRYKARFRLFR